MAPGVEQTLHTLRGHSRFAGELLRRQGPGAGIVVVGHTDPFIRPDRGPYCTIRDRSAHGILRRRSSCRDEAEGADVSMQGSCRTALLGVRCLRHGRKVTGEDEPDEVQRRILRPGRVDDDGREALVAAAPVAREQEVDSAQGGAAGVCGWPGLRRSSSVGVGLPRPYLEFRVSGGSLTPRPDRLIPPAAEWPVPRHEFQVTNGPRTRTVHRPTCSTRVVIPIDPGGIDGRRSRLQGVEMPYTARIGDRTRLGLIAAVALTLAGAIGAQAADPSPAASPAMSMARAERGVGRHQTR